MKFNAKLILNIQGLLLMLNGLFMLMCLPATFYYQTGNFAAIGFSGTLTLLIGFVLWFFTRKIEDVTLSKKSGYLVVTSGWMIMTLSGALPYIFTESIQGFSNILFETTSGYTTTGASILNNIEEMPKDILLWRSITQWIGGMGIIVLAITILPVLGIGGMQLFVAEAPGIAHDKIQPRIKETAKRLWLIYIGLTLLEMLLLKISGMSFFDSINHSLTTISTAGFSTKQESIGAFSPLIQYIIVIFMFISGANFTLSYFALTGKIKKIWHNDEFRTYCGLIITFTIFIGIAVYLSQGTGIEKTFRMALFQVVSIITTTGYTTADYTSWTTFVTISFLVFFFVGGSAGSTAGGVKIVRHLLLIKNSFLDLKRQLHPSAVIPARLNGHAIPEYIMRSVLAFIIIYIIIFVISCVIMAILGVEFTTAIGSAAACLGNIGPGIGEVGPASTFDSLPVTGKYFLSFLMVLGRLELFTVLVLFTPYFWKKQ